MKINFIGTGSGKTSLKRFHSALLISSDNHNLLVDCGDGISRALLQQKIDFNSINSILISHLHADHYTGLASLITQMKLLKRKDDLIIYIHPSLINYLKDFLLHSYLFRERLNFNLNIISIETDKEVVVTKSFSFYAKRNSHLDKYMINVKSQNLSLQSSSFLFKDVDSSAVYTGDVGSTQDLFLFDEKVNWFIAEVSHLNVVDILPLLKKEVTDRVILTHLDDESEIFIKKVLNTLDIEEKSKITVAFDGYILQHNS